MIVIFGPAGVGKSTQGEILAKYLRRKWLSAGQIIRDSGRFDDFTKTSAMIDEKVLVEELIAGAVAEAEKQGKYVVFDGQPGSPEQVEYWHEAGLLSKIECLIEYTAPDEVLIERLSGRGRDDDNAKNWQTKINYYKEKSGPFLAEMEKAGVVHLKVDASGDIETVAEDTRKTLRDAGLLF